MKRLAFLTATGSAVASVVLVASSLAGPSSAVADTIPVKKKPTPTPTQTTPPPPVADGPDCWNATEAHLFWHRDVRQDGGPGKMNVGEIAAVVYLVGNNCPNETYRFEVLSEDGSTVLKTIDIKGADHNTVNLTRFLQFEPTIAVDTFDTYRTIRLQTRIFDPNMVEKAVAPTAELGFPAGIAISDDDTGSPALNGYH
jgi:hypothetical protein